MQEHDFITHEELIEIEKIERMKDEEWRKYWNSKPNQIDRENHSQAG